MYETLYSSPYFSLGMWLDAPCHCFVALMSSCWYTVTTLVLKQWLFGSCIPVICAHFTHSQRYTGDKYTSIHLHMAKTAQNMYMWPGAHKHHKEALMGSWYGCVNFCFLHIFPPTIKLTPPVSIISSISSSVSSSAENGLSSGERRLKEVLSGAKMYTSCYIHMYLTGKLAIYIPFCESRLGDVDTTDFRKRNSWNQV